MVRLLANALFGQVGDQVGQVKDQFGQGQGQELDNIRWDFLRKQFFSFFGAPFDIFWSPKPYVASESALFGCHTSNIL